jgi:antitoxin MazE
MHVSIRRIGNSHGVVIPKPMLTQLGLQDSADIAIEGDAIVLRKPVRVPRQGWAEAAQQIGDANDDGLVMGDFANEGDEDLAW